MPTRFADTLEPLVPTTLHLLVTSIRLNEEEGRGMLVHLLRVLPLLNREACDLWHKECDCHTVLTLCGYLFDYGHRRRYLDGVLPDDANDPHQWTEALEPMLTPPPQRPLALESIYKNRSGLATTLTVEMSTHDSDAVGAHTRFALAIVQEHCAFRQHPRYTQYFGTCQRVGCSRPALLSPPEAAMDDPNDEPSEAEYWKCCRDGRAHPPTASLPSDMSFCCHGCYKAASAEFKRVEFKRFEIVTPLCQTRRGAGPTPARLYRAAVKRNLGVARELRTQPQTRHFPISMSSRERMLREQTMMLSVDLGVLYVAHLLQELPERLRPNRALPRTEDWRKHATCYLGAVARVREVYLKYGRGELARNGTELWLKRLRDTMLDIF
ncbi:MAG: hypothetical protein CMD92_07150 [Gammaproteobacteria bacterium]|nr:hypothetical protein [Gammaproteobacteria bacterium]|tara:strand:- start:10187 stop:11329 length:1143 start_codon:yes stop_codon:yes gene_type:complete